MTAEEKYAEDLDEIYGSINVCGLNYRASYVQREVDPIAFDVGVADSGFEDD